MSDFDRCLCPGLTRSVMGSYCRAVGLGWDSMPAMLAMLTHCPFTHASILLAGLMRVTHIGGMCIICVCVGGGGETKLSLLDV